MFTKLVNSWIWVSLLLCIFGFFRELRPSEPYATEFFIGWRNVTEEEVTRLLFPLGTYSYLAQLVVVFLITDILRYKPIIVFSAIMGIMLFSLMIWTESLIGLQAAQVSYGSFMACEVAYYTYIYAKVERSKYQLVTGHTRSAILAGRFIGSAVAQLLVSNELMDYRQLNYLSLGTQCISLFWAVLLPSVRVSLYFYSKDEVVSPTRVKIIDSSKPVSYYGAQTNDGFKDDQSVNQNVEALQMSEIEHDITKTSAREPHPQFSCSKAFTLLWMHFTTSYSNKVVILWSIWWALAMAGYLQAQGYIQLLWKQIYSEQGNVYNGAVEATVTLLGALGALAAGFFDSKRLKHFDMLALTLFSAIGGVLLLCASLTNSLMVCYALYIILGMCYHFMITVASGTVAKKLHEDSFALIFGINTLVALILQSLLTYVVINSMNLDTRVQYQVYSGYFFMLSAIYGVIGFIKILIRK